MHSIAWSLRRADAAIDAAIDGAPTHLRAHPHEEEDLVNDGGCDYEKRASTKENPEEREWYELESELCGDVKRSAQQLLKAKRMRQLEDDSGFLHQALNALLPQLDRRLRQDDCELELQLQLGDLELQLHELTQYLRRVAKMEKNSIEAGLIEARQQVINPDFTDAANPCDTPPRQSQEACKKNSRQPPANFERLDNSDRQLWSEDVDEQLMRTFKQQVKSLSRHMEARSARSKTFEKRQAVRRQVQHFDLQLQNLQRSWHLEDEDSPGLQPGSMERRPITEATQEPDVRQDAPQPSAVESMLVRQRSPIYSFSSPSDAEMAQSESNSRQQQRTQTYSFSSGLETRYHDELELDNDKWLSPELSGIDQVLNRLVSCWQVEDAEIAAQEPEYLTYETPRFRSASTEQSQPN